MIVARAPKVAAIITVFSTLIARALSIYIIVSAVSSYERCVFIFEMNVRFDNCVLCTISCERVDGSCACTIILFFNFFHSWFHSFDVSVFWRFRGECDTTGSCKKYFGFESLRHEDRFEITTFPSC